MKSKPKIVANFKSSKKGLYDVCIKDVKFLHQPCDDCDSEEEANAVVMTLSSFLNQDKEQSLGLAANQVGILKNVFVAWLQFEDGKKLIAFGNPKTISYGGELVKSEELCFSIGSSKPYIVERHTKIVIEDMFNGEVTLTDEDAFVVQHELDHLSGKLISDHGKPAWRQPFKRVFDKVGRNEKCICGSNKKYKKCCIEKIDLDG